ncbi:MAG TPA: hypothetical protein VMP01_29465 [Pirellulaceae bacterium]|nr:hypothetical protein [Pirellulaceae bacterium]
MSRGRNQFCRWACLLLLLALACSPPARGQEPAPAIDLGTRRELFVDHYLIDKLAGAELRLQTPRDEGNVLAFDKPWEGAFSAYVTILKEGNGKFRAYYRGNPAAGADGRLGETTCYAESADGQTWTKPSLGLHVVAGTKENNVILAQTAPFTHNFCPMIDGKSGVAANERYKALGGTSKTGLVAFVSADGLSWRKLREEPVITGGAFDSQNVPLWSESEQKYVCYFRVFKDKFRRIARTTSSDFLTWTPLELMEYGDRPVEHLYTNQTSPYFRAPHLYVSIAARFMPGRKVLTAEQASEIGVDPKYFGDCSDGVFMTTRGGSRYDRTFMDGFLKPGVGLSNWVSRTNYPALNVVETGPAEMSFYANQNYGQRTAHLRRYSLRTDGFVALHAGYDGGEMLTRPFTFSGQELEINFSTSAAGSVKVELQDAAGKPIEGFTLADCQEQIGNEIDRVVRWKGGDVGAMAGKPVRMRLVLKDADVFSFRFRE